MKNKLLVSSFRKIWDTRKKFLSLLCMALLGVGFFAGIKATSPDMSKTLDEYLDNNNVYDVEIVSTLGLTDEDIEEIKKLSIASDITGSRYTDEIIDILNTGGLYMCESKLCICILDYAYNIIPYSHLLRKDILHACGWFLTKCHILLLQSILLYFGISVEFATFDFITNNSQILYYLTLILATDSRMINKAKIILRPKLY